MQWILDNWILVLFGGGMIAMHMFGHGHGGHGGHGGKKRYGQGGPGSPGQSAAVRARSGDSRREAQ